MSQASMSCALPCASRVACNADLSLAICTWLMTAPPFCARPVMSNVDAALPSMWAAIPSSALTVTMPVPPTPVTRMAAGSPALAGGSGISVRNSSSPMSTPVCLRSLPPLTSTNAGQKPFKQLKSLLQAVWLILRFTPNSVATGSTATQFDCTEQSPQPSHTASLIITRTSGSSTNPRLRSRRSSVAQVC